MNIEEFLTKLKALSDFIIPFANTASFEEHSLSTSESMVLDLVSQARISKLSENVIFSELAIILQKFITTSEVMEIPLSTETENLIKQAKAVGISFQESHQRPLCRPLSKAPTGPEEFNIFVDESGSESFDEVVQPVLCLVGIIVNDNAIPVFTKKVEQLLVKYNLPTETEFHAYDFLAKNPKEPLDKLSIDKRFILLHEFLSLGMEHAVGVHHLSMLKSMVKHKYRQKMKAQGLNAYSHSVVWFLVTLDRACIYVKVGTRYKYYYDRTDAHRKDIGRIFRALESTPNRRLQLFNLKETPIPLESHESRFIQLADVAGFYLNRYRQFEVKTFEHRKELEKHKDKIFKMYELIEPKILTYVGKNLHLTVDWEALADFSLKRKIPKLKPPTGQRKG
jgi:hypothetical protein